MEAPPPSSAPSNPPQTSTPSDQPPPASSSSSLDPSPTPPSTDPPPSSAPLSTNPNPPQPQETLAQPPPRSQLQQQQQRPPAIPRPRLPSTPAVQRGGVMAMGVPVANYQRSQSPAPFSSFRPSHPFTAPSPSSFPQPFAAMPRSSASGADQPSSSSSAPLARQPVPGVQTIGMIGSLSTAPAAAQMRPSGVPGQNQQRPGQPQVRSAAPTANQANFPSLGVPRGPSITGNNSQTPAPQSSVQQPWMSAQGKQMPSTPSSSYRPPMRPPVMQQRPQHPQQQQQMPMPSHHLQQSASQLQQKQRQLQQLQQLQQQGSVPNQSQDQHPARSQQTSTPQQQTARAHAPVNAKSNVPALAQPGSGTLTPYNDADESGNDIISRKRVRELVTQIDCSEKLRPEIEDDLLDIADEFMESISTAACQLAKHRKSSILEAKDILLHVERHWNMALPGFSGDDIKCYKKAVINDIHRERIAMVKKSMVGSNDGANARNLSSAGGHAAANPKAHIAKTPAMGSPKGS